MTTGKLYVSLKDKNIRINGEDVYIEGIYDRIESNRRKEIIITDIVIDDIEKSSVSVNFIVDNDSFECEMYGCKLLIMSDDMVNLTKIN